MASAEKTVIVVGAGMAGLACASRLAQLRYRVTVIESRSILGGRACSWTDRRTGEIMDNGPHLFAGAYDEVRLLLRRIGVEKQVPFQKPLRVPLWGRSSRERAVLEWNPGWGRLGLASSMLQFPPLTHHSRFELIQLLRLAATGSPSRDLTLDQWLTDSGQGAATRRWVWYPLARAVFNEDPVRVSAALFVEVIARLFLASPAASSLAHAKVGLSQTYAEPAAGYLKGRGSVVQRGTPVREIAKHEQGFELRTSDGSTRQTEALCLAVPASVALNLLQSRLQAGCPGLEAMALAPMAPLVTVHLWLEGDEPLTREPYFGMVDGEFAWCFDRGRLTEDGPQNTQLALVAPGARGLLDKTAAEIMTSSRDQLARYVPSIRERKLRDWRVVKEPHAAPSLTPEVESLRPAVGTRIPGLVLAGDWVATGLPATLESAAHSGHLAAAHLDAFLQARA